MWCVRACGLISLVDDCNVKACDIWEGNVTTRREILTEHICSPNMLGYKRGSDILEGNITKVRVYIDYLTKCWRDLGITKPQMGQLGNENRFIISIFWQSITSMWQPKFLIYVFSRHKLQWTSCNRWLDWTSCYGIGRSYSSLLFMMSTLISICLAATINESKGQWVVCS